MFRFLTKNNGNLFEDHILQIGIKSEYKKPWYLYPFSRPSPHTLSLCPRGCPLHPPTLCSLHPTHDGRAALPPVPTWLTTPRRTYCNGDQVPCSSLNRAKPHAGPPNCTVNMGNGLRHVTHGTENSSEVINYFKTLG